MNQSIVIGTWHESGRNITHCPSYYAADTETLATIPGQYPVRLTFEGGYTVPMPKWLLVKVPSVRVSGQLFNGFGGVNYGATELPAGEPVGYGIQTYSYSIPDLVASGQLTLAPGFDWLLEKVAFKAAGAPKTWADVARMQEGN